jgi:cysteine desulfurase
MGSISYKKEGIILSNKLIYLDNAATTKVAPEVFEAMKPYFTEYYGNPSAIYSFADETKKVVDEARSTIAGVIGAKSDEIYFTGGGSESDNWALKATAEAYANKGKHIITSKIEHHAILHTAQWLEKQGCEVTYLDVDENGVVDLEQLKASIRPDTILISIMAANNEIGTIQPLKEIGAIAHEHGILFHTDAVQAFAHVPINVDEMNIDMLSASGHKINGPKGIGIMYIRKGVRIRSFIHGGAQERSRRAGTHNVPGIVGIAKAAEISAAEMEKRTAYETKLRDHLIERVLTEIPYSRLNGHRTDRLPNNANFCFRFIEGESMLILLDQNGICGSSGSACTSGSLDPSHVLLAIGLPHEIAHGSLRLTLSDETTLEEIDFTVDKLKEIIERLRGMSPLYEDFVKKQGK